MSGEPSTAANLVDGTQSQYVKLNVGGMLFYTTLDVLTKHDTMLRSMFSGRMKVRADSEGWILIDRSGQHFGLVLNFLRDGHVPLPESNKEVREILQEARFYCIQSLIDSCEKHLSDAFSDGKPSCLIPYITSPIEEQAVIGSTHKVDFPEARIYEETLNLILYENPEKPPPSHFEQNRRREMLEKEIPQVKI